MSNENIDDQNKQKITRKYHYIDFRVSKTVKPEMKGPGGAIINLLLGTLSMVQCQDIC